MRYRGSLHGGFASFWGLIVDKAVNLVEGEVERACGTHCRRDEIGTACTNWHDGNGHAGTGTVRRTSAAHGSSSSSSSTCSTLVIVVVVVVVILLGDNVVGAMLSAPAYLGKGEEYG